MPNTNDSYIIILKKAHLEWGTYRHTSTRGTIYGEGYLPIPRKISVRFNIFNSNQPNANIEYQCNSVDGSLLGAVLKASGSSRQGDIYAKQFQGSGNLKLIGDWFHSVNAQVGDRVKLYWNTPINITIEKL